MNLSKAQSPKSKVRKGASAVRHLLRFGNHFRPSDFGDRNGVALVITLIMLSIITFMAVTFLVLSQRERSSVTTAMDQKMARNASDSAIARVTAELLTHMLARTNFQDFDLMVSTNYINYDGLNPLLLSPLSPTNVNYEYLDGGAFGPIVNSQYRDINIASLLFNPRPPVFVVTNGATGQADFRFYLDLNRNGKFDRNGNWPVMVNNPATGTSAYLSTNALGQYVMVNTNLPIAGGVWLLTNSFAGDPEWIGVLERPQRLHSADNRFIARYAYLVVPVGKTLDLNTMHNQAVTRSLVAGNDGYMRNQGVGPWELNLAAFLTDLNTNMWYGPQVGTYNPPNPYVYARPFSNPNTGISFQDALSLISYRYNNNYNNLGTVSQLFPVPGALAVNNIDEYSDGPLMLSTTNIDEANTTPDAVTQPWSGAENPNHFFSQQDIFDRLKAGAGFAARLQQAGGSNDSYNAYTFYRLLSQLGTDSTADQGKINVNFRNTDIRGNIVPGMETNRIPWPALDFFTSAAAAMFRQMDLRDFNGNLVTLTNIPIYEDPLITGVTNQNYYTPAVHRVLQLAANIYDAVGTNRFVGAGPTNYPSVFRPIFSSDNGIVYISGYTNVDNVTDPFLPFLEPTNFVKGPPQKDNRIVNLYGVPWVIGAKKGFPNFNEFSMVNPLTVSRKVEFTNSLAHPPWQTNQVFDVAITNSFGFEAWNSYTNSYNRPLNVTVSNEMTITVTNDLGFTLLNVQNLSFGTNVTYNTWAGWNQKLQDTSPVFSFKVPMGTFTTNFINAIYEKNSPYILPINPIMWGPTFVPHIWMMLQMKVRCIVTDTTANRVVDFVNIDSSQPAVDVSQYLNNGASGRYPNYGDPNGVWDTNILNGSLVGELNQIDISEGKAPAVFNDPVQSGIFRRTLLNGGTTHFQAPYTPHRTIFQRISWQANDPLVHYTGADITSTNGTQQGYNTVELVGKNPDLPNLGAVNYAYQPWGGYHTPRGNPIKNDRFDYDFRVKDPMMEQSDNWDFPTNALPNIGWLGRIHRGTPWQTIYMKPSTLTRDDWRNWSNDNVILTNRNRFTFDSPNSNPTDDYRLFDLFTGSINPSAALGRLDVNQTNLAAWSAVLSGVNVLNNGAAGTVSMVIPPAGVYDSTNPSPVAAIVESINAVRSRTNSFSTVVFPNDTFQHAGDVLAAPGLTIASPFLNTNGLGVGPSPYNAAVGMNDEIMERIPQQIMSLLTLNQSPRFVIYSFGQTLHPADHSLVIGGTFNGLCTNYQITAESATRAVVRVEGTADPQYTNDVVNPHPDPQGRFYPPHIVVEQFNVLGPD
jgi:hypothetical protein